MQRDCAHRKKIESICWRTSDMVVHRDIAGKESISEGLDECQIVELNSSMETGKASSDRSKEIWAANPDPSPLPTAQSGDGVNHKHCSDISVDKNNGDCASFNSEVNSICEEGNEDSLIDRNLYSTVSEVFLPSVPHSANFSDETVSSKEKSIDCQSSLTVNVMNDTNDLDELLKASTNLTNNNKLRHQENPLRHLQIEAEREYNYISFDADITESFFNNINHINIETNLISDCESEICGGTKLVESRMNKSMVCNEIMQSFCETSSNNNANSDLAVETEWRSRLVHSSAHHATEVEKEVCETSIFHNEGSYINTCTSSDCVLENDPGNAAANSSKVITLEGSALPNDSGEVSEFAQQPVLCSHDDSGYSIGNLIKDSMLVVNDIDNLNLIELVEYGSSCSLDYQMYGNSERSSKAYDWSSDKETDRILNDDQQNGVSLNLNESLQGKPWIGTSSKASSVDAKNNLRCKPFTDPMKTKQRMMSARSTMKNWTQTQQNKKLRGKATRFMLSMRKRDVPMKVAFKEYIKPKQMSFQGGKYKNFQMLQTENFSAKGQSHSRTMNTVTLGRNVTVSEDMKEKEPDNSDGPSELPLLGPANNVDSTSCGEVLLQTAQLPDSNCKTVVGTNLGRHGNDKSAVLDPTSIPADSLCDSPAVKQRLFATFSNIIHSTPEPENSLKLDASDVNKEEAWKKIFEQAKARQNRK
ncbi:Treslin [Frankliniella fusca]|uniref:Treslin n=1 Tax=Frankliniella fusca TaxID=407009 RepID=A0AAE1H503_9NEOP|nr:Treslin [Frankliniella fusca]